MAPRDCVLAYLFEGFFNGVVRHINHGQSNPETKRSTEHKSADNCTGWELINSLTHDQKETTYLPPDSPEHPDAGRLQPFPCLPVHREVSLPA